MTRTARARPRWPIRGTLLLVACLAGGACSSPPATTYPLPSDGWKAGQPQAGVILTGVFDAVLTSHGACAWLGPARYVTLWPAGYRVRFKPTELIGPSGKVVATAGQYIGFTGGHVRPGTSLPSFCGSVAGGAFMLEAQQGLPTPNA